MKVFTHYEKLSDHFLLLLDKYLNCMPFINIFISPRSLFSVFHHVLYFQPFVLSNVWDFFVLYGLKDITKQKNNVSNPVPLITD